MSPAARPPKYHPPPPSSPKILHFPHSRRTRRRKPRPPAAANISPSGQLDNLFDRENNEYPTVHVAPLDFQPSNLVMGRRERVEEQQQEGDYAATGCGGDGGLGEEKWRFEAEMLREECNLLRTEREFAFKKLEKNRTKMEATLRSAVESLVSGRKKISEGGNVKAVLEEGIEELAEKLEGLHKSSRSEKHQVVPNRSGFNTKVDLLRRHLEALDGLSKENCVEESRELAEKNFSYGKNTCGKTENKSTDNMLRKMGGNSSVLTSSANGSASTSKRMTQFSEMKCSGNCKTVVRWVVEQVRAETEQWSQMQDMLRQVRGEMEGLQASRDFWENQAHSSDCEIRSLRHVLEEWKEKALAYENKVEELQLELYAVKWEIQKLRADSNPELMASQDAPTFPLGNQLGKEKHVLSCRTKNSHHVNEKCEIESEVEEHKETALDKDSGPLPLGKQLAKEKKMFHHRLKEKHHTKRKGSREEMSTDAKSKLCSNRISGEHSPLRDIGNSSCFARQSSRAAFGLHSPEGFRIRESFRK